MAQLSSTPAGSTCLCDMTKTRSTYTIKINDNTYPETEFTENIIQVPSPNASKIYGAATVSGKLVNLENWLVLGHELCGHAWLDVKYSREKTDKGERHHRTVERENLIRKEHGIEDRGFRLKDPYCGESFERKRKDLSGPVTWPTQEGERKDSYEKCAEARKKYLPDEAKKYKLEERIP
jgi:hypothetical protein